MIEIDLDHGQVGFLIHADELRVMTGRGRIFILKLNADAVCLFDNVAVGDDVAFGIDNHTRTKRALTDGAGFGAILAAEKFVKEILEGRGVAAVVLVGSGAGARVGAAAGVWGV